MNRNKRKNTCVPRAVQSINDKKVKIENLSEMSNEFNKFFVNVGKNVANSIVFKGTEPQINSYLPDKSVHSLFLNPITTKEVSDALGKLDITKAYGVDLMHPR